MRIRFLKKVDKFLSDNGSDVCNMEEEIPFRSWNDQFGDPKTLLNVQLKCPNQEKVPHPFPHYHHPTQEGIK